MAIQLPNPGLGDGQTGDNEFVMWTKVKDNFSNTTHAASRLVGTDTGQIPLESQVFKAAFGRLTTRNALGEDADANDFEAGTFYYVANAQNVPTSVVNSGYMAIFTLLKDYESGAAGNRMQFALGRGANNFNWVGRTEFGGEWRPWRPMSYTDFTYKTTTATAPNVVVESDGTLKRSSSSAKYKEVISKLELDNDLYQKAMQLKPIIYRSKADGDPNNWHFMSFLAEEIGELDPSLTQWKTHDYNEDGERVELEEKEAEGINLNAICAVLHATNIYQDKKIKELEQRLTALESNNEPVE